MKDLCIYAQSWQSNGYYPVECFKRVNNEWHQGICKRDKGKGYFFNMHKTSWANADIIYMLIHGYNRFSENEMLDSDKMYNHDLSIKDVENLINN